MPYRHINTQKPGGSWKDDHKDRSYKTHVMKMGSIMARTKRHVRATHSSVEDYFSMEMLKANRP